MFKKRHSKQVESVTSLTSTLVDLDMPLSSSTNKGTSNHGKIIPPPLPPKWCWDDEVRKENEGQKTPPPNARCSPPKKRNGSSRGRKEELALPIVSTAPPPLPTFRSQHPIFYPSQQERSASPSWEAPTQDFTASFFASPTPSNESTPPSEDNAPAVPPTVISPSFPSSPPGMQTIMVPYVMHLPVQVPITGRPKSRGRYQVSEQKSIYYRTKPCAFQTRPGGCPRGDKCAFIHDPNVTPPPPTLSSPSMTTTALDSNEVQSVAPLVPDASPTPVKESSLEESSGMAEEGIKSVDRIRESSMKGYRPLGGGVTIASAAAMDPNRYKKEKPPLVEIPGLPPRPPPPPGECWTFAQSGKCKYGASCKFLHKPNAPSPAISVPLPSSLSYPHTPIGYSVPTPMVSGFVYPSLPLTSAYGGEFPAPSKKENPDANDREEDGEDIESDDEDEVQVITKCSTRPSTPKGLRRVNSTLYAEAP